MAPACYFEHERYTVTKLPKPAQEHIWQHVIVDGKDVTKLWSVTDFSFTEGGNAEHGIAELTCIFRFDSMEFGPSGDVFYNLSTLSKDTRKD